MGQAQPEERRVMPCPQPSMSHWMFCVDLSTRTTTPDSTSDATFGRPSTVSSVAKRSLMPVVTWAYVLNATSLYKGSKT